MTKNALMLAAVVGSTLKKKRYKLIWKTIVKRFKTFRTCHIILQYGIADKAEKYAKLAVDKKEYEAYTLLITIELLKNDFAAAEKYANLAKKNNVKDADQILKTLNELKKTKIGWNKWINFLYL